MRNYLYLWSNYEAYLCISQQLGWNPVRSVESGIPDWAYGAIKEGKTVINRTDLAEFLIIFEATLGFLRLTIDGVKHYFFVYIAKGLEPSDINYNSFHLTYHNKVSS